MFTKLMKGIAIAASAAGLLLGSAAAHKPLFLTAVCIAAVVVTVQAGRAGQYVWMGLFLGVAALSNPVLPVPLAAYPFLVFDAITVILFIVSLQVVKTKPRLSMASITDRTPESESL